MITRAGTKNRILGIGFALALLAVGLGLSKGSGSRSQSSLPVLSWTDITGKSYSSTGLARSKSTVFAFIGMGCPISNLYIPRLTDLAKRYGSRGVSFFLVDSNREDSKKTLLAFGSERGIAIPIVKDKGTTLADWLSASHTPEAVVLDSRGDVAYRGRIDDNQDRSKVIRSDLDMALTELLAGKPVTRPRTISFGCSIFRDSGWSSSSPNRGSYTYYRDVAPILAKNCLVCHRAGESAPFSLETYSQARTWAHLAKDYTSRRLMPPWRAEDGWGDFYDARRLTTHEIEVLRAWADSGAPQGSVSDGKPLPKFQDPNGWEIPNPDLVLAPTRPYHLEADGADVYRNFVLPIDFNEDRYFSAIEFRPDKRSVVHHVVLYIDPGARSTALEGKDGEPGYSVPGTGVGIIGAEWGDVWVPGRTPRRLPEGIAFKVPKGAKLVMQVHYHKNGAPQVDRTQVALYNAKLPIQKLMRSFPIAKEDFVLMPGNQAQKVTQSLVVPISVHVRTIFPHMHFLGQKMKVTAFLPDGSEKRLVNIQNWDFNWQETYVYKEPVAIPKGSRLEIEAIYDNSDRNPRQPNHPPRQVRWGEQTTDEMFLCVIGLTIDSPRLEVKSSSG